MKKYRVYDAVGNYTTFNARNAAHAYELAQSMRYAPVRICEIETPKAKKGKRGHERNANSEQEKSITCLAREM